MTHPARHLFSARVPWHLRLRCSIRWWLILHRFVRPNLHERLYIRDCQRAKDRELRQAWYH